MSSTLSDSVPQGKSTKTIDYETYKKLEDEYAQLQSEHEKLYENFKKRVEQQNHLTAQIDQLENALTIARGSVGIKRKAVSDKGPASKRRKVTEDKLPQMMQLHEDERTRPLFEAGDLFNVKYWKNPLLWVQCKVSYGTAVVARSSSPNNPAKYTGYGLRIVGYYLPKEDGEYTFGDEFPGPYTVVPAAKDYTGRLHVIPNAFFDNKALAYRLLQKTIDENGYEVDRIKTIALKDDNFRLSRDGWKSIQRVHNAPVKTGNPKLKFWQPADPWTLDAIRGLYEDSKSGGQLLNNMVQQYLDELRQKEKQTHTRKFNEVTLDSMSEDDENDHERVGYESEYQEQDHDEDEEEERSYQQKERRGRSPGREEWGNSSPRRDRSQDRRKSPVRERSVSRDRHRHEKSPSRDRSLSRERTTTVPERSTRSPYHSSSIGTPTRHKAVTAQHLSPSSSERKTSGGKSPRNMELLKTKATSDEKSFHNEDSDSENSDDEKLREYSKMVVSTN